MTSSRDQHTHLRQLCAFLKPKIRAVVSPRPCAAAEFTSAVLRASLIMNSRPPNTICEELPVSPSESLSSDSPRETTTVLCMGSWNKSSPSSLLTWTQSLEYIVEFCGMRCSQHIFHHALIVKYCLSVPVTLFCVTKTPEFKKKSFNFKFLRLQEVVFDFCDKQ